jgi:nucleoside-diphosphate-sugar epimerase
MRLAITGAGGFVGKAVLAAALADLRCHTIVVTDRALPDLPDDPRLRALPGDITDPALQEALWNGADAMLHLAAVPGGAAEADPAASARVNLEATLDLMRRAAGRRFVLASTIAVYGAPPPAVVDDHTPCAPQMIYAMHKRMAEVALETQSRRGAVDGLALRIAGVVPRPGPGTGLKSAFLSDLFHSARAGQPITMPVGPQGRTWIASPGAVAAGLLHGVWLAPERIGPVRSFPLPACTPRMAELIAALMDAYPDWPGPTYAPIPEMERMFTSFGSLDAGEARRLGFTADAGLDAVIQSAQQAARQDAP